MKLWYALPTVHPTNLLRRAHQKPSGAFSRVRRAHQYMAGFSYTEVLVATFILAISLVPAIEALQTGVQGSVFHAAKANQHYRLTGRLEEVLAQPFSELEQAADTAGGPGVIVDSFSDASGTERRRLVYLARYDADNADADDDPFTGTDHGLLWVRVQIEGTNDALETLTTH